MFSRLTIAQIAFSVVLAIVGVFLVLLATREYGPGVSSDSAFYLSSAENFANGRGFVNFEGSPLVDWPPLYPFVLGVIYKLTGTNVLQAGRYLNALFFGLSVITSSLLFKLCFIDRSLWFYLGTAATFLFLPLLTMGTNIGTDLIFFWIEAVFFLAASNFLVKKTGNAILILSIISACAAMFRWVGYLMILVEIILIFIVYRKTIKKALMYSFVFGGLAALPFIAWVVGRNYFLYNTFFGLRDTTMVSIPGNIVLTFARVNHWILPLSFTQLLPPIIIWSVFLLVLLAINRKNDWIRWAKRWLTAYFLPIPLLSIFYYLFITLTIYTGDHAMSDLYDDRYQSLFFFVVFIGIFVSMDELVLAHIKDRKKLADLIIATIFIFWSVFPINLMYDFIKYSLEDGVVAYNNYNTRALNHSGLVEFLRTYHFDDDLPIYSNYGEAVYLFTGLQTESSPKDLQSYTAVPEHVPQQLTTWPPQPAAYFIWFESVEKRKYFSPKNLRQVSLMELLYNGEQGQVLVVTPK